MDHGAHRASGMGYSLSTDDASFRPVVERRWVFHVIGPSGPPSAYHLQHEKELHLIVVRNDLSTFLHVHPERRSDGAWEIDLSLPAPGEYTAFADVAPDDAGPMTLSLPLTVDGSWGPEPLPGPSREASVAGYTVELTGEAVVGEGSDISFRITRGGEPITPDPYLGAAGHLVAIRAEDLAYLHVHPMDSEVAGEVPFMLHASGAGPHRLFLQFLHGGEVRTAAFTLDVADQRT